MNDLSTPQNSASTPVSIRLNKHFVSCSAAAAGVASFFGGSAPADAAIVFSGIQNVPIHPASVNGGVYINIESPFAFAQGAVPRIDPSTLIPGWDLNPYFSGQSIYVAGNTRFVGAGSASNLALGTMIDSSQTFEPEVAKSVSIPVGSTGYIGFRFDPETVGGAQTWYGWAQMSIGNNVDTDGSVISWAYDDSGAGIAAGAIPEPSSLAALAMGAVGLLTIRQRRARTVA